MIKDKKLEEAIMAAERADGFMIMITRLNKDKLEHIRFTRSFRFDDFMPSIDEHAKMLEEELKDKQR